MPRNDLIQERRGTAAAWTTANPVLGLAEPGLETDTQKVKYGNGTDHWADLPYAEGSSGGETAYLVALGVAGLTDENNVHASLVADDRYGDLPSWCALTDGNVNLGEDAGSVAVAALDVCSLDFSGTTVPDAPGCINARVTVKINTIQAGAGDPDLAQVTSQDTTAAADGQDIQTVRPMAIDQTGGGTLWFFVSAKATTMNPFTDPISDGVASHDLYVALTKEAPGPVPIP